MIPRRRPEIQAKPNPMRENRPIVLWSRGFGHTESQFEDLPGTYGFEKGFNQCDRSALCQTTNQHSGVFTIPVIRIYSWCERTF
jgi:hypothetical protein